MSYIITNVCVSCGACEPECPTEAISDSTDIYIIDQKMCYECLNLSTPACINVCPVQEDGCIVLDKNNQETRDELIKKYNDILKPIDPMT